MRADGSGHAVAFVVMRQSEERFSVSIVNPCGEGEEYHAKEADPVRGKVYSVGFCGGHHASSSVLWYSPFETVCLPYIIIYKSMKGFLVP